MNARSLIFTVVNIEFAEFLSRLCGLTVLIGFRPLLMAEGKYYVSR